VFVAGEKSGNIVVISPDGNIIFQVQEQCVMIKITILYLYVTQERGYPGSK
jgi:hypothetical protein